jgi:cyclophilin family peptidyl-prolyl cis-trans isomerase
MNRNWIIAAVLVIAGTIALLNKNVRDKILPGGPLDQKDRLPSDAIITPAVIEGRPQVEIVTTKGTIVAELRPDIAPQTVVNYLDKWNAGYCNGKTFHRVEDWVVQGCDPKGDGTGGNTTLPTETSSQSFTIGSLGVARKATPKEFSNDSQFFIVKKDSIFLDGEYTYFGKVVSGMNVVNRLEIGDTIISTSLLGK